MHIRARLLSAAAVAVTRLLGAQGVVPASTASAQSRAEGAATLARTISLQLERVTIKDALAAIAEVSGARLTYSPQDIPPAARVTIVLDKVTVGEALHLALQETGLAAVVSPRGHITLVRDGDTAGVVAWQQGTATITGHVTDAVLKTPLSDAAVRIEGATLGTTSRADGNYTITGVAPGTYRVTARRVGYQPLTRDVSVTADWQGTADFALSAAPTSLDEVVTTAVGQERRYEVGNDIATIAVDSVAAIAPVTQLTDVLEGRATGVEVLSDGGLTGTGPRIRIRGLNSLSLSNDPIVIVDGVRVSGGAGDFSGIINGSTPAGWHPTPGRFNDLDPSQIESIDVLKGPAAAALYGTDAANGVIAIKTKHGQIGPPQWTVLGEGGLSKMPVHFAANLTPYGHTTNGSHASVTCPLTAAPFGAPFSQVAGSCVLDSVGSWQPLNHAATSLFGTGYRDRYGLQVAGGAGSLTYFLGGDVNEETGVLELPETEAQRLSRELGSPPGGAVTRPNALNQLNLRGRMFSTIGQTADLAISTSYISTYQRSPDIQSLMAGAFGGPGIRDSLSGYSGGGGTEAPGGVFQNRASESVNRFEGGLTGTWRPAPWLRAHASFGLDVTNRFDYAFTPPGVEFGYNPSGYAADQRYTDVQKTVDIGASAPVALSKLLIATTSLGFQFNDWTTTGVQIWATNLSYGSTNIDGGTPSAPVAVNDETKTLGGYAQEELAIAEHLFATIAYRLDGGSGFGSKASLAGYPKASLSWVIQQEPRDLIRLRAAYGASAVQPTPGASLLSYSAAPTGAPPGLVPGIILSSPGSPGLRPERQTEIEGGADLGFLGNRLTLGVTAYQKLSHDALVTIPLPGSLGGGSVQENLGSVENRGIDASIVATLVDSRPARITITVNGSGIANKLVSLGAGVSPISDFSYPASFRLVPGYPLYGYWAPPMTYQDLNHDGRIEPNEVTLGDSATYQGSPLPTRLISLGSTAALFDRRISLNILVDYHGGQKLVNDVAIYRAFVQNDAGSVYATSPIAQQARDVGILNDPLSRVNSGFIEPASFTRIRELGVTCLFPRLVMRRLRSAAGSVTLAVRNVALFTKYSGPDPEVNTGAPAGQGTPYTASHGASAINPEIVADIGSVPQPMYWVLKVNIGL